MGFFRFKTVVLLHTVRAGTPMVVPTSPGWRPCRLSGGPGAGGPAGGSSVTGVPE